MSVCQPLAEATEDSSGEKYPTRSMVIPILFGIFDKLQKFISDPKSKGTAVMFARKLLTALQDRFPNYKTAVPDCVCTYLDPRFKNLLFNSETMLVIQQELETFLPQIISKVTTTNAAVGSSESAPESQTPAIEPGPTPGTSQSQTETLGISSSHATAAAASTSHSTGSGSLWDSLDHLSQRSRALRRSVLSVSGISQEMEAFNEEPPIERDASPLKWWKENAARFKTLALLGRAFLCIPATQTKSERLNSTSGSIVEDRRCRLLTQHVTELTFLHENL